MTSSLSATNWREGRRLRAWELHEQGWRQCAIAAALGVTSGAVCQWMRRARDGGGPEALRQRKAPGGRSRLSAAQQSQVLARLREGAEAHGFRGEAKALQEGVKRGDYRSVKHLVTDDMAQTFVVCGTPDEVRERIAPIWEHADSACLVPPALGLETGAILQYGARIADMFYSQP